MNQAGGAAIFFTVTQPQNRKESSTMTKTRYLFLLIALLLMVGTFSGCQQGFLTGKWEGSIYTNGKEGVTHEVREFFPNNTFVWITDTTILGFT